jgi:hypothetical protein
VISSTAPVSGPIAVAAVRVELCLALMTILSGGFALGYGWLEFGSGITGIARGIVVRSDTGGSLIGLVDISTLVSNGMPS